MGGLQLTLAVLALAASVKGQAGPPCWYDSMCPYTPQDTSLPIPATETDIDARMTWCYTECGAAEAVLAGSCTFFTVITLRGGSSCKFLTSCKDADADADCLALGTCNSGPADCTAASTTVCNVLTPSADPAIDEIPWQCDTVDPYSTPVPDGETCFLSCDGWVNRANGVQAVILSTCEDGNWLESTLSEGNLVDYPAISSLPKPDALEADQLHCGCAAEPMAWDHDGDALTAGIVYDPNTLPGTTFLCTDDYLTGVAPDVEFKITPTMVCRLFCDGYHIATMSCQDGSWTGEPELGAWCYAAPTAADDVNAS